MRRGLYVVLMVVLVLRGLAGTAMAAGVLPPLPLGPSPVLQQGASHHHALAAAEGNYARAYHAAPASHAHHETGMAACAEDGSGGSDGCATADHHATTCSACEICHAAMLDSRTAALPAQHAPSCARPVARVPFESAPAALVIKPPIA
jgi:hypothetical protein